MYEFKDHSLLESVLLGCQDLEEAKAMLQAKLDGKEMTGSTQVNAGVLHAMSLIAQVSPLKHYM